MASMGNRNLSDTHYTIERDVVRLYARATGGGTGALTAQKGKGVVETAIARTGTGAYTITLADKWKGLLMFSASIIDPGTTDDWEVTLIEETVATTCLLKIVVHKAGTAADISTDEKILMEIVLSNTSQLPAGF